MAGARHRPDPALTRRLIGLLGGSFNPAHRAHRRISLHALGALGLDEVWWLVSPGNVLKPVDGMAPLAARVASAQAMARTAPIRVSAIEAELGTRYTVDTLARLQRRYPRYRFVWLMGADNLAQFHRWRDWRAIARMMPIAVIARPGYDAHAVASPAMAWLRRWRRRLGQDRPGIGRLGARRDTPALYQLRFDPDPMSASALRAADPDWHRRVPAFPARDMLTFRPVRSGTARSLRRKGRS
ncbi:nicotinate-nucleotide adenylyltransferase [Novosphingobium acidiphilum]|uniref:nicotinate-nucleotide adenylyltransferase n=1 Tax=Novosphingobium acidiphilum TaxID=505248 RepID=UPI00041D7232|nr:nicotinate-nucleotide adenylyltransferase [Novosphingobium acidiphilum]